MRKALRFGLVLAEEEKLALARLAEAEGGLSEAAMLRRLIRKTAIERGLFGDSRRALDDKWVALDTISGLDQQPGTTQSDACTVHDVVHRTGVKSRRRDRHGK